MARSAAPAEGLTPDAIAEVALAMIDESGVADFSMRRLAARLDVVPSALYWHFGDRTELLAAVSARVLGEMTLPDPTLDWDRWLRALAADYRRTLHRHPRAVALIGLDLAMNSAAVFPLVEALLDAFHRGGFRGQSLVDAYNVYVGSVSGFVDAELASTPSENAEAWSAARRRELAEVTGFPLIAAHRTQLERAFVTRWQNGTTAPMDRAFEALLDVLVEGLTATKASPRARRAARRR